jgi:hypothetical protein
MTDDGSVPQADAEATDDDISWYKPIAVILKPATEKDLEERLLSSSTRIDNDDDSSPLNYHQRPAVPLQQQPLLPWPYGSSPWAPPHFSRNIHDQHQQQQKDRLKNYYASLNLPGRVQGNLLSLARMGLVAIPNKDVGRQHKVDGDDQIELKDVQFRMNSRQGDEVKVGEVVSQDVRNNNHTNHNNHNHNNHKKNKNQWVHDLVGPPGPQGPVGSAGKLKTSTQIKKIFSGKIRIYQKAKMERMESTESTEWMEKMARMERRDLSVHKDLKARQV